MWNITYLGPKQWTAIQIADVGLDLKSAKCEIVQFGIFVNQ